MPIRLGRNRVAIVTGGGNGIGRETAMTLAEAGASVAIWDMDQQAGENVVRQINEAWEHAHHAGGHEETHEEHADGHGQGHAVAAPVAHAVFYKVDVTDVDQVEAAAADIYKRYGRIDILVNNAGITRDAQFIKLNKAGEIIDRMSQTDYDAVVAVNQKGVYNCAQVVAHYMIPHGFGRIINMSSIVGLYGNFGQTNYAASKAAVIGMTRVWARELGRRGIAVNAICPGFISTDMTNAMPDNVIETMVSRTPMGRMGQPGDIANTIFFLCSEEAGFINGAVINVDGGLVLGT